MSGSGKTTLHIIFGIETEITGDVLIDELI